MNTAKDLRSRVEAAVDRANLIDHRGGDLVTAFDSRLAGLETDLETYRSKCQQLEEENHGLNQLLDQILAAVEQDRFGEFFTTASRRIADISATLEQALKTGYDDSAADTAAPDSSEPVPAAKQASPKGRDKTKRTAQKSNLTLISSTPDDAPVEPDGDEDDDVAVMEVVERLSNLTHELADSESAG